VGGVVAYGLAVGVVGGGGTGGAAIELEAATVAVALVH
jgi:hypothetical protein